MKKSDIKELPEYYDYYISLNEDIELADAFDKSLQQIEELDIEQLKRIGLKAYKEGKWSINKIIQHLADWERIWCYRTLISVRNEGTALTGLDHNIMADNCNADKLPIEQLLNELTLIRKATKALFDSFDQQILESDCSFNNNKMSTLAMGFNIIGHQIHHFGIIKEKYFPLGN